ncbi:hypothetical protein J6590_038574 [Homalodisca vitripennis]|nr:hypothetical protein J6590_038574 [Homalodisca vitripennis]
MPDRSVCSTHLTTDQPPGVVAPAGAMAMLRTVHRASPRTRFYPSTVSSRNINSHLGNRPLWRIGAKIRNTIVPDSIGSFRGRVVPSSRQFCAAARVHADVTGDKVFRGSPSHNTGKSSVTPRVKGAALEDVRAHVRFFNYNFDSGLEGAALTGFVYKSCHNTGFFGRSFKKPASLGEAATTPASLREAFKQICFVGRSRHNTGFLERSLKNPTSLVEAATTPASLREAFKQICFVGKSRHNTGFFDRSFQKPASLTV